MFTVYSNLTVKCKENCKLAEFEISGNFGAGTVSVGATVGSEFIYYSESVLGQYSGSSFETCAEIRFLVVRAVRLCRSTPAYEACEYALSLLSQGGPPNVLSPTFAILICQKPKWLVLIFI